MSLRFAPLTASPRTQEETKLNTKELIEALQNIEAEHGVLHVYVETTTTADIRDETNMLVSSMNAPLQKCEVDKIANDSTSQIGVWLIGESEDAPAEDE
jgi:thiamine phosphate synthase YjbQ (UPF0047 family)